MKKIFAFLLGFSLFLASSLPGFAGFSDVPADHKYAADIKYLEEFGIVQQDVFEPDKPITRGEFAKWILKNAGFVGEQYKQKNKRRYLDVRPDNNPLAPYIYRLRDLGILDEDKKEKSYVFYPKKPINRTTALRWLFSVEGIPVPKVFDEEKFAAEDVKPDSEIAPIINKALELNVLRAGKVRPYKLLTRGEAARFLNRTKDTQPRLTVTIVPTVESDIVRNPKYDILVGAWNRILETYLRKDTVNRDAIIYGAIEGMIKELDDKHSDFERPGDNVLIESLSGEIEGIGAVIQKMDENIVIIAPIVGSPAEKAGLLSNDEILQVDDVDVRGMKLSEVANRIKGKKGTQVKLTIKRSGRTLTYTVTRDVVKIISALLERTDDNIAKITLSNFGENTDAEFLAIADNIVQNKPRGIVLDLRNNPGGFLNTAIQIAGYFIKSGDKVSTVRYPNREDTYNSSGNAGFAGIPTVVLVNSGSASASEIIAGALQDYKLAKIIGEKTFGKGTVQELSDFTDGSTLKLTVAEWLTPLGRTLEKNGVLPDIEVKITDEDRAKKRDPQMDRALTELRK